MEASFVITLSSFGFHILDTSGYEGEMKFTMRLFCTIVLSVTLMAMYPTLICAQEQAGGQALSPADVDTLVAPIALYPDPLISQILPAATYPDDIQAAASWLARNPGNPNAIDAQSWDLSVKAVAHYPQVLQKMAGDMDWTLALGQAYSTQQEDVLQSVQRLRETAQNAGTLQSTPQQRVVVEQNVIRIVPADPRMLYVPYYDPEVVYVAGPPHRRGLLAFTAGFMIGAWLNSDCDWYHHRVYYHGWVGSGWIAYSRPYIHANRYYVNDSFRQRAWFNPHPRYEGRPVVMNRVYVDRHVNRYEFNRNRVNRDVHHPSSAMDRINAARAREGRSSSNTRTDFGGRGTGGRATTTGTGGYGLGGRTTSTTTTTNAGRGFGHGTTSNTTTTTTTGRGVGHGTTSSTTTTNTIRGAGRGATSNTTTMTRTGGAASHGGGSTSGKAATTDHSHDSSDHKKR
jgi:hypothetical protein